MNESLSMRRQPQQARGQQRVAAILNAAELVFAEVGYSAATTNAIAARAHTNIGSLYQFFPNKEAIFAEVVARYRQEYDELAEAVFAGDLAAIPLGQLIDRLADAVFVLHRRHGIARPFFVRVGGAAPEFSATEQEVYGGLMQRGDQALAYRAPRLTPDQRRLALQVVLRTCQALVHLADTSAPHEEAAVIAAMKTMLHAHIDSLEESGR
jgi:AcrR family transcriptional regulator